LFIFNVLIDAAGMWVASGTRRRLSTPAEESEIARWRAEVVSGDLPSIEPAEYNRRATSY
jgi:hypothetical protein